MKRLSNNMKLKLLTFLSFTASILIIISSIFAINVQIEKKSLNEKYEKSIKELNATIIEYNKAIDFLQELIE